MNFEIWKQKIIHVHYYIDHFIAAANGNIYRLWLFNITVHTANKIYKNCEKNGKGKNE